MLTRTTTRRSAAVLMVALVAMLLVAVGGSARASQARVSAGTGHASATPPSGRQVAALPSAPSDQAQLHLDLASTPPIDLPTPVSVVADRGTAGNAAYLPGDGVTAVGRGPPTR